MHTHKHTCVHAPPKKSSLANVFYVSFLECGRMKVFNIRTLAVFKPVPFLQGPAFLGLGEGWWTISGTPRLRAGRASGLSPGERDLGEVLVCEGVKGRRKEVILRSINGIYICPSGCLHYFEIIFGCRNWDSTTRMVAISVLNIHFHHLVWCKCMFWCWRECVGGGLMCAMPCALIL